MGFNSQIEVFNFKLLKGGEKMMNPLQLLKKSARRGQVGLMYMLMGVVGGLVGIGILVAIGLAILGGFSTSTALPAVAQTGVNNTITQLNTIPSSWLGIVVIGAIGIALFSGFGAFFLGRGMVGGSGRR